MPKKKYPARVRFVIADDIRSDSPKPMVLGFFSNDEVGIPLTPDAPDPTKEKPIALQGLAILASFIDCRGSFAVETSLYQPDGSAIFENQKIEGGIVTPPSSDKATINFIAKFVPFTIPLLGTYKFVIKLDKKEYCYEFSCNRQALPAGS